MRIGAAALGVLLSGGCAFAPGMRMDEQAAEERGRATTRDKNFRVETIRPDVLLRLSTEARGAARTPDPLGPTAASYQYTIAPFDVLQITVWDHPELTIPAGEFRTPEAAGNPVGADGRMFYPYVGVVEVAGKTLPELRRILTERLARIIRDPQLDVRVAAFRGRRAQITGEVTQPSVVPITDIPVRVQDAIAFARGLTPEADPAAVTISRGGKAFHVDMQAFYDQGDATQNWVLQDGDVVNVGDRRHNRVFVLGEVRRPLARPMNKGRLSLADALGDSEFFDPAAANPSKIYVIRGDFQAPQIYRLDAESPDALLLATQFPLRPRDVVFVSTYNVTRFNRVILQILPAIALLYQIADLPNRAVDSFDTITTGTPD